MPGLEPKETYCSEVVTQPKFKLLVIILFKALHGNLCMLCTPTNIKALTRGLACDFLVP